MKPRSVVIAMAVAAGFTAGLTGCTPIPITLSATLANPWMPGTRTYVVKSTLPMTDIPDDLGQEEQHPNYRNRSPEGPVFVRR